MNDYELSLGRDLNRADAGSLHLGLSVPLTLPVEVVRIASAELSEMPKLLAGGKPLTPINVVLSRRIKLRAASECSIATYTRACLLYAQFCAHLRRTIVGISNGDFEIFLVALLGERFRDADGSWVKLEGKRNERTSDLMVSLMYSIARDIEQLYQVRFDWLRYEAMPREAVYRLGYKRWGLSAPRLHRIKHAVPKAIGLPDDQFARVIRHARELWLDVIPDGDRAFIYDRVELEKQRGALFYRNLAIILVMGGEGARRSEVDPLRFDDLDPVNNIIHLTTKGHGGDKGRRLPVLMQPVVYSSIIHYATTYRPTVNISAEDRERVFLSHSPRNYGHRISPEAVRKIVDSLRDALDEPWRKILTPHKFRHRFAYMLQRLGGPLAVLSNMRHANISSLDAYTADVEEFADELLGPSNARLQAILNKSEGGETTGYEGE